MNIIVWVYFAKIMFKEDLTVLWGLSIIPAKVNNTGKTR